MKVILLRTLLLFLASSQISAARSQDLYPGYKTVVDTVVAGRCLFMEGFFTDDQSATFIAQYLSKQGLTGTRVKNIGQQKTFEADVERVIKRSGGCGKITQELLKKPGML
jgi:hypothetical protein